MLPQVTMLCNSLKLFAVFEENEIPVQDLIMTLTDEQKKIILYGTGEKVYKVKGRNRFGENTSIYETYSGVVGYLLHRWAGQSSTRGLDAQV